MAVTILRYPGGLEYPEQFQNNVKGLTPIGSYTLSDQEAIAKFPGLQYSLNTYSSSTASPAVPSGQSSYTSIQSPGTIESITSAPTSVTLDKEIDDLLSQYLDMPPGAPEKQALYEKIQQALKNSSNVSLQTLDSGDNSNNQNVLNAPTSTQQNLAIIEQQAEQGNVNSQEFLKTYKDNNLTGAVASQDQGQKTEPQEQQIAQALPAGPSGMDRAPGTYHPSNIIPLQTPGSNWRPGEGYMIQNPFERSPVTGPGLSRGPRGEVLGDIAGNQGPSSPIKYDENMKQYVPNPGAGRPANVRYKGFPLSKDENKPEFDEQKALIAKQTADEYRRQAKVEDPFRSKAVG